MRYILFALFSLLAFASSAQVPDPTRPADEPPAAGASGSGAGMGGVQAIILRKGGKSSAVIDGEEVHVGQRIGGKAHDKRVLKISENAVIVQGENGRETMRLIATVEKVPAARPHAIKKASSRGQTGTSEK